MTEVFLCETGQLTDESKRALKKAGVVVAEVQDIERAHFIRASEVVSADDFLWAALDAVNARTPGSSGASQRERLAVNLLSVVTTKRKPPKQSDEPRQDEQAQQQHQEGRP